MDSKALLLLLLLIRGPDSGDGLVRAARRLRLPLLPGAVYPGLQALREVGKIRRAKVQSAKVRGQGRPRVVYELAASGRREARRDLATVRRLLLEQELVEASQGLAPSPGRHEAP